MRANSLSKYFGFSHFGESHGRFMGLIIEDVKPGIDFPYDELKIELEKRKPGKNFVSSARKEDDDFEVISGVFEGKTTGMPICILFKNKDFSEKDYSNIKNVFRPGHSDYSWYNKFKIYDYRGGGRSSGRETISRVAAGAFVKEITKDIEILSYPLKIGYLNAKSIDLDYYKNNVLHWPDENNFDELITFLKNTKKSGDSIGAIVEVTINNVPLGLGDPVFEKLDANISKALMSIGGIKGIEFGEGFNLANLFGSESNDQMYYTQSDGNFITNNAGGITGGVSNGNAIKLRLSIKAVPSIEKNQITIDTNNNQCKLSIKGRHDVCLIPRILPVIDNMIRITLADAISYQKLIESEELNLNDYREAIEKIDEDLLIALYRRFEVSKQIGNYKRKNNLPIYDKKREEDLLMSLSEKAIEYKLPTDLVNNIWNLIIKESKNRQC